ncbi:MAG: phosphatidylserine decarboxylase family protein [Saprospiraceae bacterium]
MMRIHREGLPSLLWSLVALLVTGALSYYLSPKWYWIDLIVFSIPVLFFLQFFRNPVRAIEKADNSLVYAPADGKVVVIEEAEEREYLKERRIQVSIFMSPLNVHVNRNPVGGKVEYSKYHPGKYLVAWHPKSSSENERTTVVYNTDGRKLLMRQIAGAVARRIVCYLKEGQEVVQGEDMGFIKLGSRVDLFLPLDAKIEVKIGDVVKGNQTLIARW